MLSSFKDLTDDDIDSDDISFILIISSFYFSRYEKFRGKIERGGNSRTTSHLSAMAKNTDSRRRRLFDGRIDCQPSRDHCTEEKIQGMFPPNRKLACWHAITNYFLWMNKWFVNLFLGLSLLGWSSQYRSSWAPWTRSSWLLRMRSQRCRRPDGHFYQKFRFGWRIYCWIEGSILFVSNSYI